jgi:hypothetical protein
MMMRVFGNATSIGCFRGGLHPGGGFGIEWSVGGFRGDWALEPASAGDVTRPDTEPADDNHRTLLPAQRRDLTKLDRTLREAIIPQLVTRL